MSKKRLYEVSVWLLTNLENEAEIEKNVENKEALYSIVERVRKLTYELQRMYVNEALTTKAK